MKIVTLTENEFIDFANKHQYNSLYQTPLYAHFMNKNEHYKIHYLGFVEEDNLIGASLMLYKTLFWGYKYAYAPRGFLIDYSDEEIVTKVSLALKNLLRKQKFIFITIDPPVANMGSTMMRVFPFTLGEAMYSVWMPTSVCSRLVYMRKADTKPFSAWSNTRRKPS